MKILFLLMLAFSMYNKNRFLRSEIKTSIGYFNSSFDEKIYILKNEVNFLEKTKKELEVPKYKTKGRIKYFEVNGYGVYFDTAVVMPKTYDYYDIASGRESLNRKFNNSFYGIIYNKVRKVEATELYNQAAGVYRGRGDIAFVDKFDERWAEALQKKMLSKSFFKNTKSVSRDNIEFVLYDSYIDKIYGLNMFSIIIPNYEMKDDIEFLNGIWYFDFDNKFFDRDLEALKTKLNLDILIVDSKNEVMSSTDKELDFKESDMKKYYSYNLSKTNYKILVKKITLKNLLGYQELIFFVLFLALGVYLSKRERLEKEVEKLKIAEKIRRHLMLRDPLTKLYNRYFIEKGLEYPIQNCGVVLIDIDYFKSINDNFGHSKGDHVLRGVSNVIKLLGGRDVHGIRWGGEEFLVVFKNTDRYELLRKIELIAASIKKLDLIDNVAITVSVGAVIADIETKECLYSAIAESDKNLYKAKVAGRDRIVM
ncbi:GGDEF domain-containing protein [Cetobacterium sp.]|uniref:GGDEF domain-containing protein n=1 Tax=Cetobacterium sp. TaxID=2071632 RepID=UPI003F3B9E9C